MLKASPLLDVSQGLKEVPFVKKIVVISVNNECKELLFFSEKNFAGHPTVETFNLTKDGRQFFPFQLEDESKCISRFSQPQIFV